MTFSTPAAFSLLPGSAFSGLRRLGSSWLRTLTRPLAPRGVFEVDAPGRGRLASHPPFNATSHGPAALRPGRELRCGDLILHVTSTFWLRWSDHGSGADLHASFYQPVPPVGFFALSSVGLGVPSDQLNPNGQYLALCARDASSAGGKPALAAPLGFDCIWQDRGSDAVMRGSCWRPLPPAGYVSLGDVFVTGYLPPSFDEVRCVAHEQVVAARLGAPVWSEAGARADRPFSAWQIESAAEPPSPALLNGFLGNASHRPPASAAVYTLPLPSTPP